jgi:peptide/nickel transport system ATP-binding protein
MHPAPDRAVLELAGLRVRVTKGDAIVEDVDLQLAPGEILGLVGESGSGKTTTALSLLGYSAEGLEIVGGTLELTGRQVRMDDSMRALRGATISYVPQDPSRSLNPSLRIGAAITNVAAAHSPSARGDVVSRVLEAVGLPLTSEFRHRFPHQLSGGQQQRVLIAMALVCEPSVIVLDEPTTSLDVVTQARILDLLRHLRDERKISMVYVTHDLAVVGQIADRIAVMYAGRLVEQGDSRVVLTRPRHPYTRGLLASVPDHARPRLLEPMAGIAVGVGERPVGCPFEPRCPQRTPRCVTAMPPREEVGRRHEVRCFHHRETPAVTIVPLERLNGETVHLRVPVLEVEELYAEHRSKGARITVAEDVNLAVHASRCVALVGESGSGKTTIARAIAGLHPIRRGRIKLDGAEIPNLVRRRTVDQRRRIQLVFQSAAAALNPRHRVFDTVERPVRVLRGLGRRDASTEVGRLLECVRLPARTAGRYPHELSGGERQRVALARALAANPDVILCDEITSALDVSVQAAVLEVLADLRAEFGLSLLFITHDLGVVATIADEILVLENGVICEQGTTAAVLAAPRHPYTRRLLDAAPSVLEAVEHQDAREAGAGEAPSSLPA